MGVCALLTWERHVSGLLWGKQPACPCWSQRGIPRSSPYGELAAPQRVCSPSQQKLSGQAIWPILNSRRPRQSGGRSVCVASENDPGDRDVWIAIHLYAGFLSAAVMLVFAVASILVLAVKGLATRDSDLPYHESVKGGFRIGIAGGLLIVWLVFAVAFVHFRDTRRVVIDYWWSLTWIINSVAASGVAMVLLLWYLRSFYLRVKGRLAPATFRRQIAAMSCAYLCLWGSGLAAYRWMWMPWYRINALHTAEHESFSRDIFPALETFVAHASPVEERVLLRWLDKPSSPNAQFNAAYILAKRDHADGRHAMAKLLINVDAQGTDRYDLPSGGVFPVGLARACVMQVYGFKPKDDTTPPQPVEWQKWKQWYQAQPTVANHYVGTRTE